MAAPAEALQNKGRRARNKWREPRTSLRQRIRPHLEMKNFARRPLPRLHVERRARRDSRPQSLAFPAGFRIVNTSIHPLRIEPCRIRHTKDDELSVFQCEKSLGGIARVDGGI